MSWLNYLELLLVLYLVFLSTYFLTGWMISRKNLRAPEKKIQDAVISADMLRREILRSVRSLFLMSALLALGIFLQSNGYGFSAPKLTLLNSVLSYIGGYFIYGAWFYWNHRLMHHRWLFRRIHAWHHRARAPVCWSNNSDTHLEGLMIQSYFVFVIFFIPIHPYVLFLQKFLDQVLGMYGHAGYEYFASRSHRWPFPFVTTIFHDQHHQNIHCNYGSNISFWDRWMGTIHPEYDKQIKKFTEVSNNTI